MFVDRAPKEEGDNHPFCPGAAGREFCRGQITHAL